MKSLTFPDWQGNQVWTYFPDDKVHQIRTTNVPGTQDAINTYGYDRRGKLTTETLAVPAWYTYSLGYGYDGQGNLSSVTYPSGRTVEYAPNALGQPSRVKDSLDAVAYASQLTYHPNGSLSGFRYGNGIVFSMTQSPRQLPETVKHGTLIHLDHYFDANANLTAVGDHVREGWGLKWLEYDGLDRLTHLGFPQLVHGHPASNHHAYYTYDTLDNISTVRMPDTGSGYVRDWRYCYDGRNRLTAVRSNATDCSSGSLAKTLGHDEQGNVAWNNEHNFEFDYGNRLRGITHNTSGSTIERYRYDGHGRRILANNFASGVVLSQYAGDGKLMYQNSSRTGQNHTIDHIYLTGTLLAQREVNKATQATTVKYQHTDPLGSPVLVTDVHGGTIEQLDYDAYGKALSAPNNTGNDRPGYTGHVGDRQTGLTYMQQRYQNPELGVFLSVDPVTAYGDPVMQFHRYRYSNNNPYKFTDPDGRQSALARTVISPPSPLAGPQNLDNEPRPGGRRDSGAPLGRGGRPVRTDRAGNPINPADVAAPSQNQSADNNESSSGDVATAPSDGDRVKTPNRGEPGSVFVNPNNGQERLYGDDGLPEVDVDYNHDHGAGSPHDHNWTRGSDGRPIRGPGVPSPEKLEKKK